MKKEEIYIVIDSIEKQNKVIEILEKNGVLMSNLFKNNTELIYLNFDKLWYFSSKSSNKMEITLSQLEELLN
jgi:hypothetical protein